MTNFINPLPNCYTSRRLKTIKVGNVYALFAQDGFCIFSTLIVSQDRLIAGIHSPPTALFPLKKKAVHSGRLFKEFFLSINSVNGEAPPPTV